MEPSFTATLTPQQTARSTDPIATTIRAQLAAEVDARVAARVVCAAARGGNDAYEVALNASSAAAAAVEDLVAALAGYIVFGDLPKPEPVRDGVSALHVACDQARARVRSALPVLGVEVRTDGGTELGAVHA